MMSTRVYNRALERIHATTIAALFLIVLLSSTASSSAQTPPGAVGSSPLPSLRDATGWINSPPLTARDLEGKVVLVDFWDYSCINCIRTIPYISAWAQKYKDSGLVVIGVHTPEFDVAKQLPNVQKAVTKFGITYPVALDNDYRIWNAFHNQYWPAHYFIDAKGKVRYEHFGEGEYDQSEHWIQKLLKEAHEGPVSHDTVAAHGEGAQAATDMRDVRSPETYIGYARAQNFASPGGIKHDIDHLYNVPGHLSLNEWGLAGSWVDGQQAAITQSPGGKIVFRFHARDLHLVLGTVGGGKSVRFRVTIDGRAPGADHGVDTDPEGNGIVKDDRLYQMIRQTGPIRDHTFEIEFLDAGVQAFSFTFG